MGDITNSCRSVPVSADPSVACSRASSAHSHRGLGAIQGEQWGISVNDKMRQHLQESPEKDLSPQGNSLKPWQNANVLSLRAWISSYRVQQERCCRKWL
eukprot:1223682-Karenia_brevis.AAC.1